MRSIKKIIMLAIGTLALPMLLTSCEKDNKDNDAFIGKWANTAQSYEITIAGQENIPEGCICMEFTDKKVWISDSRTDCLPEWHKYTLSKKDGKHHHLLKGAGWQREVHDAGGRISQLPECEAGQNH